MPSKQTKRAELLEVNDLQLEEDHLLTQVNTG